MIVHLSIAACLCFGQSPAHAEPPPPTPASAPEPTQTETVTPRLKVGDSRYITMRGSLVKSEGGHDDTTPKLSDAIITVLDQAADSWTVEIALKPPTDESIPKATRNQIAQQIDAFNTPLKVKLASTGEMTLVNLAEVKDASFKAAKLTLEMKAKADGRELTEAQLKIVFETVERMFADESTASALLLQDFTPLFIHLGHAGTLGKPSESRGEIPAVIVPGTIKTVETVTLADVEQNPAAGRFTYQQILDKDDAKRVITAYVSALLKAAPAEKQPTAGDIAASEYRVQTDVTTVYDRAKAWPVSAKMVRLQKITLPASEAAVTTTIEYVLKEHRVEHPTPAK